MADRPEFTHRRERNGLVGPFSGRQLLVGFVVIVLAVIGLAIATTPLGTTGGDLLVDPRASAYVIGPATEGLKPGNHAPELAVTHPDGKTFQLTDLDGKPIRLADLRGKVVWLDFWAHWCPPCQQEMPILRDLADRYGSQGLAVVAVAVQETSVDDIKAYAATYQLDYTIGFDAAGDVFHAYQVYALPTQFFIDGDGVIRSVVNGPVEAEPAEALIRSMLGLPDASPSTSASPPAAAAAASLAN